MYQFAKFKSKVFFCFCLFSIWGNIFFGNICAAVQLSYYAKVIRILDGDTIEIIHRERIQRVRIWGIDTPEWDQPYAAQATKFTRNLLENREVQVLPREYDDYGRLVATVKVDGKNIGEELIRSGLAWVHDYYCTEQICDLWKGLQTRAVSERRGLWNDHNPIAPWKWKRSHSRR